MLGKAASKSKSIMAPLGLFKDTFMDSKSMSRTLANIFLPLRKPRCMLEMTFFHRRLNGNTESTGDETVVGIDQRERAGCRREEVIPGSRVCAAGFFGETAKVAAAGRRVLRKSGACICSAAA